MSPLPLAAAVPFCGGRRKPGTTTYSVDLGTGVIVVRNVPAAVCDQCGEEWIAGDIARKLEELTEEASCRAPAP